MTTQNEETRRLILSVTRDDDSAEPGWSVNRGRPLWLGEPSRGRRQVMTLGGPADPRFAMMLLVASVSATLTRQQVAEHFGRTKEGVRKIDLTRDDLMALALFARVTLGARPA